MISWLSANIGTILVLLVVCAVVGFIVRGILRDRKNGKSSCGGSCGSCASCGSCGGGSCGYGCGEKRK